MNNEQNDQWKCECGETVTANGEHLCGWGERFDEKYASVYEAYPEYKESHSILLADIKEFIRKERLQARSDALLEAVELISQIDAEYQGEDYRRGFNETKEKATSALRKKINDPNDEIIQKILKDLPTLPEKMKRIDETKE